MFHGDQNSVFSVKIDHLNEKCFTIEILLIMMKLGRVVGLGQYIMPEKFYPFIFASDGTTTIQKLKQNLGISMGFSKFTQEVGLYGTE